MAGVRAGPNPATFGTAPRCAPNEMSIARPLVNHRKPRVWRSPRCPSWVTTCLYDYVGITAGVPPIADDFLQRPSRQSRAKALNRCAIAEARLGRGGVNQGGDHR